MLNTTGKIFERIICTHLEKELDQLRALSDHQFGFRRKRSTIDAIQTVTQLAANAIEGERWLGGSKEYCLVCTLDVKNAFNSANWNLVLQALHRMGISNYLIDLVADYFKDRVLTYSSDVEEQREVGNQPALKRRSTEPTRSSGSRKAPQLSPMSWARCSTK